MNQQPKYYFQGFEGARKVQSMMIDFPELRFVSDKDGLEVSSIVIETLRESKHLARCTVRLTVRLLTDRTMYINGLNLSADDTTSKIFVAPECEGFFEPQDGDDIHIDHENYGNVIGKFKSDCIWINRFWGTSDCKDLNDYQDLLGSIVELKRNGKRIWMPQAVDNG